MMTSVTDSLWFGLSTNVLVASCLRLALVVYGLIQDQFALVKYTDIDYIVFTDAARLVSQDESPYLRSTYRYTPLLAWLLQPNIFLNPVFGKILFSVFDILAGYIIFQIVSQATGNHKTGIRCTQLWLFNPITVAVSTRGNAESLMAVLVLGTLYFILQNNPQSLIYAGVLYGTAVHMKIYPVIYILAIYLFLNVQNYYKKSRPLTWRDVFWILIPGKDVAIFGVSAFLAFSCLTAVFYARYGDVFLHETYFYHLSRCDIRHNFSPYFYMLYLVSAGTGGSTVISLSVFIPQVVLTIISAMAFHRHIEFACFVLTFIFVTFNKVCTSQYFLWYLCLMPLVVPHLSMSLKKASFLSITWLAAQGLWLLPAYLLEFQCFNSFLFIWLAGLAFFSANVYILIDIIISFQSKIKESSYKKDN